jgi:hypothetical protein
MIESFVIPIVIAEMPAGDAILLEALVRITNLIHRGSDIHY